MNDKSTEIVELREKVKLLQERARLLQEIVELKKQIAELEDQPVRYSFRYRCEPYPNGTPWFPDTWSTSYQPNPGEVLVVSN